MYNKIIAKWQEKYFKTDIVASYVEVCNISNCKYEEILEFASFIMGETIDINNLSRYRNDIMDILKEQYPNLKRNIYISTNTDIVNYDYLLGNQYLSIPLNNCYYYLNKYKEEYGEYMLIKTKENVKQLRLIKNTSNI